MTRDLLGQTFSLLAALTWAMALVLFKRSGERIAPVALNLFKNAIGLVLLLATLGVLIAGGREDLAALRSRPAGDLCLLMLSGIIGIALADTLFFRALNLIGVGLMQIVDCIYSPLALLFSWLLLAETLRPVHYAGAALIISGVAIAANHPRPVQRTRWQIVAGVWLAILAIAMMAFGIVVVKPILEDVGVLRATTLRMAAGGGLLALLALLGRDWRQHWTVFRPAASWKYAVPAAVLGAYLSMVLWVAGFAYTSAAVAAMLNQTSVIFACVLAAVFLKERFGPRQIVALVLALTGVLIVTLAEPLELRWRAWLGAV